MKRNEAIDVAVRWWAEKLQKRPRHSNGDNSRSSTFACMMADLGTTPVCDAELDVFVSDLMERVDYDLNQHGCSWLCCDYGPCNMLAAAAKKAGINTLNFPFKTNMKISLIGREEYKVEVSDGYGRPYVEITNERSC